MYRLTFRDPCSIARRVRGEVFGPAKHRHGLTCVDLALQRKSPDAGGGVVDIELASQGLPA